MRRANCTQYTEFERDLRLFQKDRGRKMYKRTVDLRPVRGIVRHRIVWHKHEHMSCYCPGE